MGNALVLQHVPYRCLFPYLGCQGCTATEPDAESYFNIVKKCFPWDAHCRIPETERRGISTRQLEVIIGFAKLQCRRWKDRDGVRLRIGRVNLYYLDPWLISPATKRHNVEPRNMEPLPEADHCSMVELVCGEVHEPVWFISHAWAEYILNFLLIVKKHEALRIPLRKHTNFYWVCAYANRQHNLAEAVPPDPKDSAFYKAMFVAKENCGGVLLVLDEKSTPFTRIWCGFEESQAIEMGLMIDVGAVTKGGAELMTDGPVDIEMTDLEKRMTGGTTKKEMSWDKAAREQAFPLDIIQNALDVQLEKGKASHQKDRQHILNSICKQTDLDQQAPEEHEAYRKINAQLQSKFALLGWRAQLEQGESDTMDRCLQKVANRVYADNSLTHIRLNFLEMTKMNDKELERIATSLPANLDDLVLGINSCTNITYQGVTALVKKIGTYGLRPQRLELQMGKTQAGDDSLTALGNSIQDMPLTYLALFLESTNISDNGINALARCIPSTMEELILQLDGCTQITDAGLEYLAPCLSARNLKKCTLILSGTGIGDAGFGHLSTIMKPLKLNYFYIAMNKTTLSDLGLGHLAGLTQDAEDDDRRVEVRDSDTEAWKPALVDQLEPSMTAILDGCQTAYRWKQLRSPKELHIVLDGCKGVTDNGVRSLTQWLRHTRLKQLHLDVDATKVSAEMKKVVKYGRIFKHDSERAQFIQHIPAAV